MTDRFLSHTLTGLACAGLFMMLVSASAFSYEKRGGTAEDYAAIEAIEVRWQAAYGARDFDALAELYTEDGWVMARRQPAMRGRAQIRDFFQSVAEDTKLAVTFDVEELEVIGDYAWNTARFALTYQSMSGAAPVHDFGRALILYKKGLDGLWRIHRDMDTPTPDAEDMSPPTPR
ncbi:MAG: SgcJ/EcaC family oxidoreductase [Rhodospirillaceae bacterium]